MRARYNCFDPFLVKTRELNAIARHKKALEDIVELHEDSWNRFSDTTVDPDALYKLAKEALKGND